MIILFSKHRDLRDAPVVRGHRDESRRGSGSLYMAWSNCYKLNPGAQADSDGGASNTE